MGYSYQGKSVVKMNKVQLQHINVDEPQKAFYENATQKKASHRILLNYFYTEFITGKVTLPCGKLKRKVKK